MKKKTRGLAISHPRSRGSALLAVMWISAALAAIAFSLSSTVRSEGDRASTELDGVRAYFLATGAVERASLELLWSATGAPGQKAIARYSNAVDYSFATGTVHVEILPETGKLAVNQATPEELDRLLLALGAAPADAEGITEGIIAWRSPEVAAEQQNSAQGPSFQPAHASFQEIEELLLVRGVTPDLFYGSFVPANGTSGPLVERPGLMDCLSAFGTKDQVDINTAQPAVLEAVGVPPGAVAAIVERRKTKPFSEGELGSIGADLGPGAQRIRVEGNSIVTFRATARLRTADGQTSDLKRTVAAMIKYMPQGFDLPFHVLHWWDFTVGSN